MKVYELVRRLVDTKGFTGVAALTNELKTTGLTLPSRHTIRLWALAKTSPFSGKRIFNGQPSEELSFFLGAWIGDGWGDVNDGGKRMLLKVRSYDFAKEFAMSAAKILGKTDSYWVRRITNETGMWYLVKVTSFMLYDFANQPLETLREHIETFPRGFLRGFFTAEGNPSTSISHRGRPRLDVGVCVSNSDHSLLEFTRELLMTRGLRPGQIRLDRREGETTNFGVARSSTWLLVLSKFDHVKEFARVIGFADANKQQKLMDAISLIEGCGRIGGAVEWMKLYEKRRGDWVKRKERLPPHDNYCSTL